MSKGATQIVFCIYYVILKALASNSCFRGWFLILRRIPLYM